MVSEPIYSTIISQTLNIIFRKPIESVKNYFLSNDANNFAKNRLKSEWEPKIFGHYDFVIDNFHTSLKEIIDSNAFWGDVEDYNSYLTQILYTKSQKWIDNKLPEEELVSFISEYLKQLTYYFIFNHSGFANLNTNLKLDEILKELSYDFKINKFQNLDFLLIDGIHNLPDKFLLQKDLTYFIKREEKIIDQIINVLSGSYSSSALLIGAPVVGKTVLSFFIGSQLLKAGYHVYYYGIKSESNVDSIFNEIIRNDNSGYVFIIDDCHQNISFTNEVINQSSNLKKASCLFISRDLPIEFRCIEEYKNEDFFQKFDNRKYVLKFYNDKEYESKVKGIIKKYETYYLSNGCSELRIGDFTRVINNTHKNLLTLYYNLKYWPIAQDLSRVDKNYVLREVYRHFLDDNKDLVLRISSLWQYEIYYKHKSSEEELELKKQVAKGNLIHNQEFDDYHFYHSDFARLLLRSFEITPDFKKRYKNLRNFVFENIKSYIISFDEYPPNLEDVFHNLSTNHCRDLSLKLLKDKDVNERFVSFYKNFGLVSKLLYILFSLQDRKYALVKNIVLSIPDSRWLIMLKEQRLSGLSYSLTCLMATFPEKAETLTKQIDLSDISSRTSSSNIVLISNSLIELNKASPQYKLGTKVFLNLDLKLLIDKINSARFEHIGKSISEFRKLDKYKTKNIYRRLDIERLKRNAKQVNLKALGKTLNELNILENELKIYNYKLSKEIYTNISIDLLLEKIKTVSLEGLGRALNELKNIDPIKTKNIFKQIDMNYLKEEFLKVKLHQIGHTLSEFKKIDFTIMSLAQQK